MNSPGLRGRLVSESRVANQNHPLIQADTLAIVLVPLWLLFRLQDLFEFVDDIWRRERLGTLWCVFGKGYAGRKNMPKVNTVMAEPRPVAATFPIHPRNIRVHDQMLLVLTMVCISINLLSMFESDVVVDNISKDHTRSSSSSAGTDWECQHIGWLGGRKTESNHVAAAMAMIRWIRRAE